jgi:hypothetical protein
MKKIMMWATITMLVAGCEKKPEAVQTQNTAAKTEEVKPKVQANQLTEKEIQDLESLEKSSSEETASTAGYYLSNLEVTSVQEIRDFIAKNKHEKDHQEKVDQIGTSMQYRAGWEDQLFGPNDEIKKGYLVVVSIDKSIALDRIIVDRGKCNAVYRDGVNPLHYGDAMSFFVNCDPRDVTEVIGILKDGREIKIPPR